MSQVGENDDDAYIPSSRNASSNAIRPSRLRFSETESYCEDGTTTLAGLQSSTLLSGDTTTTTKTTTERTLEERRKLRCVVIDDSVVVPGCICGLDRDGTELGLDRGRDYDGSEDGSGMGGDRNGRGGDGKGDGKGGRKGDGRTGSNKRGRGGKYGKYGRYGYGYGYGYDYGCGYGYGYGYGEDEEEGGGAGERISYDEFMQLFFEPCQPRELSEISSSYISCAEPALQRTVAIIRPEAMEYRDAVLRAIFEAGFQIIARRYLHLTPEQVSEIYQNHYGTPSFPHLVVSVSAAPVLVLVIAALDVVAKWRKMISPDGRLKPQWFFPISMRKRFGLQPPIRDSLHGSENLPASNNENRYFNPKSVLEPVMTEKAQVTDYCNLYVNPTLLNGLTEVAKKRPLDPIIYLGEWLLTNNPFQPRMPYFVEMSPT